MRPLLSAVLAAFVLAAPVLAADGTREARGTIAALTDTSITLKAGPTSASCGLSSASPSVAGYHVGDRVAILCRRSGDHWLLAKIRRLETKPTAPKTNPPTTAPPKTDPPKTEPPKTVPPKTDPPKTEPPTTTFGGTVTAVSASSITVHYGDRDLTCSVGPSSPPLGDYRVGDQVGVACTGGVLVKIVKLSTQPPPEPTTTFGGTVSALSSSSITVHDGNRDLTCSVGPSSPPLGDYHIGDHVYVACAGGVLLKIAKAQVPPAPAPVVTFKGTLAELGATSVTVKDGEHSLTCSIGSSSPPLGDYHVGDQVYVGCVGGVLAKIAKLSTPPPPPPPTPTPTPNYTYAVGTIAAISDAALTVHSDGGDVTCKRTEKSPRLGDFHVGDHVKMYCADGGVVAVIRV